MRSLSALSVGQAARIVLLRNKGPMRQRLSELGFTPGAEVTCLFESMWHDPHAYRVCGAVIALRREDAEQIEVWEEEDP